jgi:hypothetical protein
VADDDRKAIPVGDGPFDKLDPHASEKPSHFTHGSVHGVDVLSGASSWIEGIREHSHIISLIGFIHEGQAIPGGPPGCVPRLGPEKNSIRSDPLPVDCKKCGDARLDCPGKGRTILRQLAENGQSYAALIAHAQVANGLPGQGGAAGSDILAGMRVAGMWVPGMARLRMAGSRLWPAAFARAAAFGTCLARQSERGRNHQRRKQDQEPLHKNPPLSISICICWQSIACFITLMTRPIPAFLYGRGSKDRIIFSAILL